MGSYKQPSRTYDEVMKKTETGRMRENEPKLQQERFRLHGKRNFYIVRTAQRQSGFPGDCTFSGPI